MNHNRRQVMLSQTRCKVAVLGLAAYLVLAWVFTQGVAPEAKAQDAKGKLIKLEFGVGGCDGEGCHGKKEPKIGEEITRFNELTTWKEKDKHADAYKVIDTDSADKTKVARAIRMEKILQVSKGDKNYKVNKDPDCLACHAVRNIPPKEERHASFKIEEGVTCSVCHGSYRNWVDAHYGIDKVKFRKMPRKEKEEQYGLRDLWDPVKRAELCSSCHIGNEKEGKFVTHQMYAAGHPPLPSFELATFVRQMPQHWAKISDKPKDIQKMQGLEDEADVEFTRQVLVGGAMSLHTSMNLVADQAQKALDAAKGKRTALDLSNFDCAACHHELRSPSWRQERGYIAAPGRVPPRVWENVLPRIGIDFFKSSPSEDTYDEQILDFQKAMVARPYGDAARVVKAARTLGTTARGYADAWAARKLTKADVASLAKKFPEFYGDEKRGKSLDFDSARQIGWGLFEIIVKNTREVRSNRKIKKKKKK